MSVNVLEAYRLRTLSDLTYTQIGQLQGVHPTTVQRALQSFVESLPTADQLKSYEEAKGDLLNATTQRLLASLADPDVLAKANLRDRAVTFGIVFDKHRLQTAQSTSNISVLSKIISQADSGLFKSSTPQPVVDRAVSAESTVSENE